MADHSKIEWTEATWSVVTGCTRISDGCTNCYIERTPPFRMAGRTFNAPGIGGTTDIRLHPERLAIPLRWRKPRRIFVCSLADLFHKDVPDGLVAALWFVMGQCAGLIPEQYRGHTFQILTKRPDRMRAFLRKWADVGDPSIPPMVPAASKCGRAELIAAAEEFLGSPVMYDWMDGPRYWPVALPGVWLGVSVENQQWADIRVPALLDTPAAVRWLSCEPLLGPVNLYRWIQRDDPDGECKTCGTEQWTGEDRHPKVHYCVDDVCTTAGGPDCPMAGEETGEWCGGPVKPYPRPDWVVVGGESGPGARPAHPDWFRSLRDQCVAAEVPFFMKQAGAVLAHEWNCTDRKGHNPSEWPEPFPREYPNAA